MAPKFSLQPIIFERLVGRNIARFISEELDLAGSKMAATTFISIAILGGIAIMVLGSVPAVVLYNIQFGIAFLIGAAIATIYEVLLYSYLELKIDQRRQFVETVLPDYLQLTAANMRSGVTLSRAMAMAVRPNFKYVAEDINIVSRQLYAGGTMQNALTQFANKYRSTTLKRTVRIIIEAEQYGGGMADLLNQIAKDTREQQIIQKEVSGQLFMYTIFIAFAALVGAPTLYGLTSQMISVTTSVWSHISLNALSNTPTIGASFMKLSKPQLTPSAYFVFSIFAIIVITGFGAFIISAISTGSAIRGMKYLPVFIIIGLIVFFVISTVMSGLFVSFGSGI